MAVQKQIILCMLILFQSKKIFCIETENDSKEELVQSESKDGNLEIIKQIKKVNDDGSYTIGYEADDGSFKIESRDVLGNIKGTYGFLDDDGQIKRVSYSTTNSSEVLTKVESPSPSVVQRIPKLNKTTIATTTKPVTYSNTQASQTASTSNVIQSIARRRTTLSTSTTTSKPNYNRVINVADDIAKPTTNPNQIIYTSAAPRVLVQGKPLLRSTPATQTQKSEGQLVRPEVVTPVPTPLSLYRKLGLQHTILNEAPKPVTEEPEVRSNILRRQLPQENGSGYNLQEHIFRLQQSIGEDATDVYGGSVTTRPLFTTTIRPPILSSTQPPVVVSKPVIQYPSNYQNTGVREAHSNSPEYTQETSTTESAVRDVTPTPIPVVQIPANRATSEPFVAIRHPYQRGTVLVPLSHINGRVLPIENNINEVQGQLQYDGQNRQVGTVEPGPIYLRRVPPPPLRSIPVQVDENGYIREMPQQFVVPTPYTVPVPDTQIPKLINNNIDNEIESIEPPVSTRDFQKLLQMLIFRQSKLERVSVMTDPRRNPDVYQPRYRTVYQPTPAPYFFQRSQEPQQYQRDQRGPVQFIPSPEQTRPRQFVSIPNQQQQLATRQQQIHHHGDQYDNPQSYVPTRRVARLLPPRGQEQEVNNSVNEQYLPPDVREMLLLRMLQLALNPSLPVEEGDEEVEATTRTPQYKKPAVRNVEILGEEIEENMKTSVRNKRYRKPDMDYYE